MRLTHESPRVRWLVLLAAWALVAGLGAWHMAVMRDYVASLEGVVPRATAAATPLQRPLPSNYADAMMWTRYALALQEGAPARVRTTEIDNAPGGREVHWHSGLAHLLALAGRLQRAVTGEPLPRATEQALAWFNLPLLIVVTVFFSAWTARRAGAAAGALVALGLIGVEDHYAGCAPNYVDHHGLLSAAVFGVVLGAVFMGGGWWRARSDGEESLLPASPEAARGAATFSAVCGAIGLWISAATVIPVIVIVGGCAVLASAFGAAAARREGARFDAALWRWWGRLGAGLSVGFYLLEYAPSHLGLRLEVNHPLHALAWWGGGELVALLAAWRAEAPAGALPRRRALLPLGALAAAPVVIVALGTRVFVASDPFVAKLSHDVAEGASLWRIVGAFGWKEFFTHVNFQLVPLALGVWCVAGRGRPDRLLLGFATLAGAVFVAMGFWKIRWWLNAGGPMLALLIAALAALLRGRSLRVRWTVVAALAAAGFVPATVWHIGRIAGPVRQRIVANDDAVQPVYRDVAGALRAAQPTGEIVLLASPNASVSIGYYGRFKTLGTLYWENTAGLRAAAEIFSAETDEEALRLFRRHGVTHLAIISRENYFAEYFALLRPDAPATDIVKTFGHRLGSQLRQPAWLRSLPYANPAKPLLPDLVVRLYQFAPDQSLPEVYWHLGRTQLAGGNVADAETHLAEAITHSAPAQRAAQAIAAANLCYRAGAHAAAARFFRAALAERPDPAITRDLSWVLATSGDAAVRDGTRALALLEELPSTVPRDYRFKDNLAAALAACGRLAEAAEVAARALDEARAAGDGAFASACEKHLAAYRAGQPWRQ
ncbi:MAG: hypothetical protein RLZZ15_1195 [Verrucomicrobiota bacterium]